MGQRRGIAPAAIDHDLSQLAENREPNRRIVVTLHGQVCFVDRAFDGRTKHIRRCALKPTQRRLTRGERFGSGRFQNDRRRQTRMLMRFEDLNAARQQGLGVGISLLT